MTRPPPSRPHPAPVLTLTPPAALHVDAEPLLRLRAAEGAQAAHALVARAREDLAHRLDRVAVLYGRGALLPLAAEARGIALAAHPVGLVGLAQVAGHVAACAGRDDPAALSATVARLLRLGERAVDLIGGLRLPDG